MKYKRILLKLSGESLGGEKGVGLDVNMMSQYAREIAKVAKSGVQIAIVIGGGNIFRGVTGVGKGFSRVKGDQMGMLATVINSIGLSMSIKSEGIEAEVFTSTPMEPMARYYAKEKFGKIPEVFCPYVCTEIKDKHYCFFNNVCALCICYRSSKQLDVDRCANLASLAHIRN